MPRRKAVAQSRDELLVAYDQQLGPPSSWREALVREQTRKAVAEARKAELEALEAAKKVFTADQFEAAVRAVQYAWEQVLRTLPQRVLASLVGADAQTKAQVADAILTELRRCGQLVAEELRLRSIPTGEVPNGKNKSGA